MQFYLCVPVWPIYNFIFICISVNSRLYECEINLLLWKCLNKIFYNNNNTYNGGSVTLKSENTLLIIFSTWFYHIHMGY